MADFTQHELFQMGLALEHYYDLSASSWRRGQIMPPPAEIMRLRKKLLAVFSSNLGEGCDIPEGLKIHGENLQDNLHIDAPCRVIKEGHEMDGRRCILERLQVHVEGRDPVQVDSTQEILDMGIQPGQAGVRVRAWVLDGILNVREVPADSLLRCD